MTASRAVRRFHAAIKSVLAMKVHAPSIASVQSLALVFALASSSLAQRAPEAQKESDWVDARWNATDLGNFHASLVALPGVTVAKGLSIRLVNNREASIVYDTATASMCGLWSNGFLKFDAARYGLIRAPKPAGEILFVAPKGPAWNAAVRWRGFHVHGSRVVLDYTIGTAHVLESPWSESIGEIPVLTRSFEISNDTDVLLTLAKATSVELTNIDGRSEERRVGKEGRSR